MWNGFGGEQISLAAPVDHIKSYHYYYYYYY